MTRGERGADRLRNGIPADRNDQTASDLARHDYEADTRTRDVVESLASEVAALRAEQAALHEQLREPT